MLQLLERLCQELKSAPLHLNLDSAYYGSLCFRGFIARAVRLDNLVLPTGGSAVSYLVPKLGMQAGAKLHVRSDCTKNKKWGHCQITLTCNPLVRGVSRRSRQT